MEASEEKSYLLANEWLWRWGGKLADRGRKGQVSSSTEGKRQVFPYTEEGLKSKPDH